MIVRPHPKSAVKSNSVQADERKLLRFKGKTPVEYKRICEWAVYDPYADMQLIYGIGQLPFESSQIVLSS